MAKTIFISYAAEDKGLRDKLVDQANDFNSEVEFIDMPEKDPSDTEWRDKCQRKIEESDGVLFLITKNSLNDGEQFWQVNRAKEEDKPRKGVWGNFDDKPEKLPFVFDVTKIIKWNPENIFNWIDSIESGKEG